MQLSHLARTALPLIAAACLCGNASAGKPGQLATSAEADRTRAQITAQLNTFLLPEQNGTAQAHQGFWADDLVYTSSAGLVMSKADIMKSFDDAPKADAKAAPEPAPVFTAEDILVRPYGQMAALTFRLVMHDVDGKTVNYRNSGTFMLRHGKWQAITWQATKVAEPAK